MELIVGGKYQGKLCWALEHYGLSGEQVVSGGEQPREDTEILYHLEERVRLLLEEGKDPKEQILSLAEELPNLIFICDEVGNGVVPMSAQDRAWREAVGRTCCALAQKADRVYRVWCGIGTRIK